MGTAQVSSPIRSTTANMQIPKQMSRPADPSKPSFLERPGEIRNLIYGVLFKRDEPVLLHDAGAYHAHEPKQEDFPGQNLSDEMSYFDHQYESEIGVNEEFIHGFHAGLPLLRVCRQIYHEAIGVFYSNNTFIFSRVLDRHDRDAYRQDIEYHQLSYAPVWLSGIGSHFGLLKKVLIDFDAMCHPSCRRRKVIMDMLPLLRFLWGHNSSGSPLKFACTGRRLRTTCCDDAPEEEDAQYMEEVVADLNLIVGCVTGHDDLSLKKYAYSERLITNATFHLNSQRLSVYFGGTTWSPTYRKYFSVNNDGKIDVKSQPSDTRRLLDLPSQSLYEIIAHAVHSPSGIILDLNSHTAHGLNLEVLQMLRRQLYTAESILGKVNDVTIVCRSNETATDFDSFKKLRLLMGLSSSPLGGQSPGQFVDMILAHKNPGRTLTIALDFEAFASIAMCGLRINVKDLMDILSILPTESTTVIRITLRCPGGSGQVYSESKEISADILSRQLFLLLSDVQADDSVEAFKTDALGVPDVWMNGHGQILYASYPASASSPAVYVENRHARLQSHQAVVRGRYFIRMRYRHRDVFQKCFHTALGMLRGNYWTDYEVPDW